MKQQKKKKSTALQIVQLCIIRMLNVLYKKIDEMMTDKRHLLRQTRERERKKALLHHFSSLSPRSLKFHPEHECCTGCNQFRAEGVSFDAFNP